MNHEGAHSFDCRYAKDPKANYQRSISLPSNADMDSAIAVFEQGTLNKICCILLNQNFLTILGYLIIRVRKQTAV